MLTIERIRKVNARATTREVWVFTLVGRLGVWPGVELIEWAKQTRVGDGPWRPTGKKWQAGLISTKRQRIAGAKVPLPDDVLAEAYARFVEMFADRIKRWVYALPAHLVEDAKAAREEERGEG